MESLWCRGHCMVTFSSWSQINSRQSNPKRNQKAWIYGECQAISPIQRCKPRNEVHPRSGLSLQHWHFRPESPSPFTTPSIDAQSKRTIHCQDIIQNIAYAYTNKNIKLYIYIFIYLFMYIYIIKSNILIIYSYILSLRVLSYIAYSFSPARLTTPRA